MIWRSFFLTVQWAASLTSPFQMQNQRDGVVISRLQSRRSSSLSRGVAVLAAGPGAHGAIASR